MKLQKRRVFLDSFRIARQGAWPVLSYFVIVAFVMIAVTGATRAVTGHLWLEFSTDLLEMLLITVVAERFYAQALLSTSHKTLIGVSLKLFLAALLVGLLFFIIGFLVFLFLILLSGIFLGLEGFSPRDSQRESEIFFEALNAILASPSGWLLAGLIMICFLSLGWLAARLTLFGVATADAGRIRIFQTWGWTHKNGFALMLMGGLLVAIPLLILLAANLGFEYIFTGRDILDEAPLTVSQSVLLVSLEYIVSYPIFLLGHGYAVAVYRQLCPELVDIERTFS